MNKSDLSSTEFAALLVSEGRTTDVTMANALADGYPIDPDQLERAFYRRALGFDVDIYIDPAKGKAIIKDLELGLTTTCAYLGEETKENMDANAKRLSKACMKLKKKHDDAIKEVHES